MNLGFIAKSTDTYRATINGKKTSTNFVLVDYVNRPSWGLNEVGVFPCDEQGNADFSEVTIERVDDCGDALRVITELVDKFGLKPIMETFYLREQVEYC